MLPFKYRTHTIFQHHFQWKKCILYSIKYGKLDCLSLPVTSIKVLYLQATHWSQPYRTPLCVQSISLACKYWTKMKVTNTPSYYKIQSMEQHALRNVNNCKNTNIYSYLETSGFQNSNLYLNIVHFFNTGVN
jgi:hypothetical protein